MLLFAKTHLPIPILLLSQPACMFVSFAMILLLLIKEARRYATLNAMEACMARSTHSMSASSPLEKVQRWARLSPLDYGSFARVTLAINLKGANFSTVKSIHNPLIRSHCIDVIVTLDLFPFKGCFSNDEVSLAFLSNGKPKVQRICSSLVTLVM